MHSTQKHLKTLSAYLELRWRYETALDTQALANAECLSGASLEVRYSARLLMSSFPGGTMIWPLGPSWPRTLTCEGRWSRCAHRC